MKRSRLFRAAAATSAVVCGALAVLSTSALAAQGDEYTTAELLSPTSGSADEFTWSYEFHQNGGQELSNLAIGFCDDDILEHVESASQVYTLLTHGQGGHDGFDGLKFDDIDVSGEISVTFDQAYEIDAAGLLLQSHSGDGDEGDEITTAPGPGPCPETETTIVVTNQDPTTTTTAAPTTTTTEAPTTTTTIAPAVAPQVQVLGEVLTAPVQAAELPRTGRNGLVTLTLTALALMLAGLACTGAPRLRRSH